MDLSKIDFKDIKEGLYEELFYGTMAGITICIIGHPFDTIKTWLQVKKQSMIKLIWS